MPVSTFGSVTTFYAGLWGTDNLVTPSGRPVPAGVEFAVYETGTVSCIDLYVDAERSAAADNPGVIGANGNLSFWADPGVYDLVVGETTMAVVVSLHPAEGLSGFASASQGLLADTAVQPGDLATVATSGDFDDLTDKPTIPSTPGDVGADPAGTAATAVSAHTGAVDPHGDRAHAASLVDDLSGVSNQAGARTALGLGTAATTASTDYATATQGSTADTAVQPGDLAAVATSGAYADLSGAPTIPSTPGEVGADPAGTAAGLVDDLSGVTDQTAARTALGLGSAAVAATGDFDAAGAAASAQAAAELTASDALAAYQPNIPHIEMTVSQPGGPGTDWRLVVPTPLRSAVFVPPFTVGVDDPTGTFDGVEVPAPSGTDDPRWWLVAPVSGAGPGGLYMYDPTDHATVTGLYTDDGAEYASATGAVVGLAVVAFVAADTGGGPAWVGGAQADSVLLAAFPDLAATQIAASVAAPFRAGGIGYRPANMGSWFTTLAAKASAPVDVVILGDSVAEQDTTTGLRSWPYHLERILNERVLTGDIADGWRSAQAGVAQIPGSTTASGSATNEAPGGRGLTMSGGQTATYTATMDGVSIVYGKDPSYGSLEVRDGATLLDTISTTGTAKGGFVWTSGALTSASHTITVTSVGANRLAGWQIHNGTRASGVRVWNASRGGMGTDFFTGAAVRGLDLIENLQPDLVVLATGTNDAVAATYDTRMRALVNAVQAIYSGPIALWIPPVSTGYFAADAPAAGRLIAADEALAVIDAAAATGEHPLETTRWIGLGPHPGDEGTVYLASYAAAQLSGDPIGEALRQDYLSTLNLSGLGGKVTISAPSGASSYGLSGLTLIDTLLQRMSSGTFAVGSVLSILLSAPDGVVWGGRRQAIDAQTGTAYSLPLASIGKLITRSNAGASTMVWPKDTTAAVPVGSIIETLNLGAGTVTNSAEAGATLITGSTTAQAQGKRITAYKVAANTWLLAT